MESNSSKVNGTINMARVVYNSLPLFTLGSYCGHSWGVTTVWQIHRVKD